MPRGESGNRGGGRGEQNWQDRQQASRSNLAPQQSRQGVGDFKGRTTARGVAYAGGKNGYSNTMAAITRQQYNDWLNRFAPTEDKLVELATSGELYTAQEGRNQSLAQSNLSRAENQAASTGARFGLGDLRTDQQKNNLKINNALSLASMNNEGRQALGDLQNRLISGVSNSKGQQINKLGEV